MEMRAIILVALIGSALAVPKSGTRIVGGSPTTIDQYPLMANMQYQYAGWWWWHACGGSLINNRSILSAAHCYIGDRPDQWRVILGTSFPNIGGTVYYVSQIILHPNYDHDTLDNDIAIIHLSSFVTYSSTVQPGFIPSAAYNLADGTYVTAVGWGVLQPDEDYAYADQLQRVDVNIINQELCAERYAYLKTQPNFSGWPDVTDNMICTGILDVGGKDACQGDSGGPILHQRNVIVGVISWGYSCAHHFYPGVNARVNRYTDWISNNA